MTIERIIDIIEETEHSNLLSSDDEIEIGVNEETEMLTISKYNEDKGSSFFVKNICNIKDVDLEQLWEEVDKHNWYYVPYTKQDFDLE